MRFLLFIVVVAAGVGLFLHDKQQTADLAKALQENAQLTQQLTAYQAAVYQLKAQAANSANQAPAYRPQQQQQPVYNDPMLQTSHIQPSGPLGGNGR